MTDGDFLSWERDGATWPNGGASHFRDAAGLRWHIQEMGTGPSVLLLHGTGASTHSWRDVIPALAAAGNHVFAVDLPGHGFTSQAAASTMSLTGMAAAVASCIKAHGRPPALVVGHSAGAAIAAEMTLSGAVAPSTIVSFNGALLPFRGLGRHVFPVFAKLLFQNSFAPRLFSWRAQDRRSVERVLQGTGSHLDAHGIDLYTRLFRSRDHVAGTLAMMANWELEAFSTRLPRLSSRLRLIVGTADRAVPPDDAFRVQKMIAGSDVRIMRGLGHLAHEEAPAAAVQLICEALAGTVANANAGAVHG